ncbi:S8 family serine peptidase [Cellulomonas sp. McL0617]|uniref:S8 family serine peptidase n=1 Tax=Cellulomonas sp. McL0617 TaxID=3415675 RepID=UPI003CF000F6
MRTLARLAAAAASIAVVTAGMVVQGPPALAARPVPAPVTAAPSDPHDPTDRPRPHDRGPLETLPQPKATEAAPADHVLVKFAARTSGAQQRSTLSAAGVSGPDAVPGTSYVKVAVGDESPAAVVARLRQDPQVADVQLDHRRTALAWTDDPDIEWAWPYLDTLRLPRAWDSATGAGTVVAVLDTGVTAANDDLAGQVLTGTDLVDGDADPADPEGHGTLVAGIIAAKADNQAGSVGTAYGAKILPVRVLDQNGEGDDSTIAAGIAWAVTHGARVVSLSLGGPDPAPVLLQAIEAAVAAGVVVVAAAGNDGTESAVYPAAYAPQVAGFVSVSSTDEDGALLPSSSWGDSVSLAAPGDQIIGPGTSAGSFVSGTGTSFSAAIVSGVAALVRSHAGALTPAQVEQRLESTARDAGPRGVDPYYGAGVVDAAAAVTVGDPVPAATGIALDEAPGDAGTSDDTRARAQVTDGTEADGTISPEGDVDWYRYTAPTAGWYTVYVHDANLYQVPDPLDLTLEVRDDTGHVLSSGNLQPGGSAESVTVPMPVGGHQLFVAVRNANGTAQHDRTYVLSVGPTTMPSFTGTRHPSAQAYQALAVGDVTGDGRPDVVAVHGVDLQIVPDTPSGVLGDPTILPVPGGVTADGDVAVADLDGDGDQDVAVTTSVGVQLFVQSGGQLTAGATLPIASGGLQVVAGDIDGDGRTDLLADSSASVATIYFGTPAHTLGPATPTGAVVVGSTLADVNGDGRLDIVGTAGYFLQQPDHTFGPLVALTVSADAPGGAANSWSGAVKVGDVTGDGLVDVVRTNLFNVYVSAQLAAGGFAPAVAVYAWQLPGALALDDVDHDGRLDVVTANNGWDAVSTLLQQPDGTLGAPVQSTSISYLSWYPVDGLQMADLDGDGYDEAVMAAGWLYTLHSNTLAEPHPAGWVKDLSPAPRSTGVAVRPTLTVALEQALPADAVVAGTVRLVDGTTGADVALAAPTVDAGRTSLSVTPAADLVAGHQYEMLVASIPGPGGTVQDATVRSWFTVGVDGDRFTPLPPERIIDTRLPGAGGPLVPGEPATLDLSGLPADASAIVLNLTAVNPRGNGYLSVYPTPTGSDPPPLVSNVNFVTGIDQPNLVTVRISADRTIDVASAFAPADVIADVAGYYSAGGAAAYQPLVPARVLDTRLGMGAPKAPLTGGRWIDLVVAGPGTSVPSDATAIVLNVTGTAVSGKTHVRVFPTPGAVEDQTPPVISNLNLYPGRDQANLVTVAIGEGGRVRLWLYAAQAQLVADVAGYYTATGANGYVALAPGRLIDTRSHLGLTHELDPGAPATARVAGARVGGQLIPDDATAAVLNLTGANPRSDTHVRAFPASTGAMPLVSNLNLVTGRNEANLAVVRIGDDGAVTFYSHVAPTDLVVDVSGYFRD